METGIRLFDLPEKFGPAKTSLVTLEQLQCRRVDAASDGSGLL